MEDPEVRGRATGARVARLATVRPDGAPHVVPIVFAIEGDTLYTTIDAKPKGEARPRRLENIEADPRVELVVDAYEEDWEDLWWVRLSGTAAVHADGPERERGLELLRAKYPQYERWAPLGEVIVVRVESWRGWTSGPPEMAPRRPG